jgi:hypothetical protein
MLGTKKTSLYVKSYGGGVSLRNFMGRSLLSTFMPKGGIRLGGILTYMGHIAANAGSARQPVVLVHG